MSQEISSDEILDWARHLYNLGIKRPGTPAGRAAERYIVDCLKNIGLSDVREEAVPFVGWWDRHVELLALTGRESRSYAVHPLRHTAFTTPAGVVGPVVDLQGETPSDISGMDLGGKIALVDYPQGYLPYDLLVDAGHFTHDPDGSLPGGGQPVTWSTEEGYNLYQAVADAGAAGVICILPLEITPYLLFMGGNSETGQCGRIPGVVLRKAEGAAFRKDVRSAETEVTLILTGETRPSETANIAGVIPGESERVIQITTHHDTMWLGATEDCAAVGIVLGLARHYAGTTPRHTLVFVLEAAECLHVLGARSFIEAHRNDLMKNLIADLHVEHIARESIVNPAGFIEATGNIQARACFVTDSEPLRKVVKAAIVDHDLKRTVMLPTDTPLGVPTDAMPYAVSGLPIVSLISAPPYWNALEDTWDKIAVDQIMPTAGAYIQIIDRLLETDADTIRKPQIPDKWEWAWG